MGAPESPSDGVPVIPRRGNGRGRKGQQALASEGGALAAVPILPTQTKSQTGRPAAEKKSKAVGQRLVSFSFTGPAKTTPALHCFADNHCPLTGGAYTCTHSTCVHNRAFPKFCGKDFTNQGALALHVIKEHGTPIPKEGFTFLPVPYNCRCEPDAEALRIDISKLQTSSKRCVTELCRTGPQRVAGATPWGSSTR
jgi:hypothetical protein